MPNRSDPTKKLKLGDYVEVLVPLGTDEDGNPTYEKGVVSRAGLSDEKWADVKARAEASGRLSTIKDSEKTRGGSSDVEGDVIRFRDKSGGTVVVARGDLDEAAWSKRVAQAADKDSFESATQDGEVVSAGPSRAKKVGTDNLADEGASPTVATRVGGDGTSPSGGTGAGVTLSVDEGAGTEPPVQKPMLTNPGQREPVLDEQASGPRKFFGDAIKGALPGGTGGGEAPMSMPAPGPGAPMTDGGVSSFTDGGVSMPTPAIAPSPMGVSGGAAPDAGVSAHSTGLSSPPPDASSGQMPNMGNIANEPLTNPVDLAVASKMSPGSGTAPMSGQMSAPPTANNGAQASMAPPGYKASMSVKDTVGTGTQPGGIPSLKSAEGAFMKSQAIAAETDAAGAREKLKERAKYESDVKAFEADQKAAVMRQRESEDRINNAYLTTLDEMSKKASIDPDHFWSSKSVGQKAFMAIGGFLAGLGGRDPSGRLDQMINQDIVVQRENYKMAQEQGKAKLAGLDTVYGRLRDRGLDDREAAAAARASMNQGLINRLEMVSEQMKPGEAQAKAQMAIANFRMNKVKAEDDLKNSASERWARSESLNMKKRAMEMEVEEAKAKAEAKAKEETPMQATLSKEMAALEDVRASLLNMNSLSSGGFVERAQTQIADFHPLGGISDPDRKAKARTFKGDAYASMLEKAKGALQGPEIAALSQIVPQEISAFEDPEPYFKRAVAFVEQQIARRKERYSKAGPDTRGPAAPGAGGAR